MAEKSGLELLQEIVLRLDRIEQQLKVQDQNIKKVANSAKIADLVNKAAGTGLDSFARANRASARAVTDIGNEIAAAKDKTKRGMQFNFESSDASKVKGKKIESARRGPSALPAAQPHGKSKDIGPSSIMCKGKMLVGNGDDMAPIPNLSVKIFNTSDKLVKETKTNRAGHWMSQLPPGKYVVSYEGEFKGSQLTPMNKKFEVPTSLPDGESFVEVT